eukprot:scaffold394564_cov51-Attheya_sp.AAC.1
MATDRFEEHIHHLFMANFFANCTCAWVQYEAFHWLTGRYGSRSNVVQFDTHQHDRMMSVTNESSRTESRKWASVRWQSTVRENSSLENANADRSHQPDPTGATTSSCIGEGSIGELY